MRFIKSFFTVLLFLSTFFSSADAGVLLKDMQGNQIDFSDLKGKWVLINYWASWCHPCVDEIPELNRFYQQHKNDGIALFAVNFEGLPLNEQQQRIKQFAISYPSLQRDPAQDLALGDIKGVPVTFVFNPDGQLVQALYGGQSMRTLEKNTIASR